jgi:hypothetical protein
MPSITEQLAQRRRAENAPKNLSGNSRKKLPSGHGDGKWETKASLKKYREARNKKRKAARRGQ